MKLFFASLIAVGTIITVCLTSCQTPDVLKVDTKLYTCGVSGHSCGNGACCGEYEDCGGQVLSCPKDMCCYNGSDSAHSWGVSRTDGGEDSGHSTRMHRQTPAFM